MKIICTICRVFPFEYTSVCRADTRGHHGRRSCIGEGAHMKLCSEILLESLSRHMVVECIGKKRTTLSLNPPRLLLRGYGLSRRYVFIGRVGELPLPPDNVSCLIVCVGGALPAGWNPKNCCAFSVTSSTDCYLCSISCRIPISATTGGTKNCSVSWIRRLIWMKLST